MFPSETIGIDDIHHIKKRKVKTYSEGKKKKIFNLKEKEKKDELCDWEKHNVV